MVYRSKLKLLLYYYVIRCYLITKTFNLIIISVTLYFNSVIVVYNKFLNSELNFSLGISIGFNVPFFINVSNNCSKIKIEKLFALTVENNLRRRVADQNFFF